MEKKSKIQLTNESIRKKFNSSFDLVNYAIKLAENMIGTGRDARVKSEVQNRAMLILEEIIEGKDQFDEIVVTTSFSKGNDREEITQKIVYEDRTEKKKAPALESYEGEE